MSLTKYAKKYKCNKQKSGENVIWWILQGSLERMNQINQKMANRLYIYGLNRFDSIFVTISAFIT